jgi:zinc transport system ATP-binding protein
MTDVVVQVQDVTFGYGRRPVLEEVSLDLHQSDYLAVLGPNGGGKTTLLKVLLGLVKPWRGTVTWNLPHGRRRLGYVPQFSTFEAGVPLRVEEVVRMGRLGLRGLGRWYRQGDRQAAREALEAVRLEDKAGALAGELSGGQAQRVLLARALVGEPEAIFLDEPMASLDADSRKVVREILLELRRRMPVVVVTHDPAAIAGEIRHIACLNRRLTYHGDPDLSPEVLEETYGCPVELIAHGVPHRVLPGHEGHGHG